MKGYLEDLKVGGRPMTDKELAEHYKHLYSEVKKQKDDVVEYIKEHLTDNGRFLMLNEWQVPDLLRMLGEIDEIR